MSRLPRSLLAMLLLAVVSPVPASASAPAPTATPAGTPEASAAPLLASEPTVGEVAAATLLIYSGRPDPAWPLSAEQVAELDAIIASLPTMEGEVPLGGLGYRGFVVSRPVGSWTAYDGTVTDPGGAPGTYLADPGHLVERYLLASGIETLAEDEAAAVMEALGPAASPTAS